MSWVEDPGVDIYKNLNLSKLAIDQAYVNVTNSIQNAQLYVLSDECHRCPFTRIAYLAVSKNTVLKHNVAHSDTWRIYKNVDEPTIPDKNTSDMICQFRPEMGEFGVYNLDIDEKSCVFTEERPPVNIYLPILLVFFVLIGLAILCKFYPRIRNMIIKTKDAPKEEEKKPVRRRVKSLDTFRGMSIVLMIFVNDGAGRYWWMEHATWNGLTIGDLVFPFFMWIMGVCIPISVKSLVAKKVPKSNALWNIFRRSCILFLIGVALNTIYGTTLYNMRVFGVLQRFGIAYYVVGSIAFLLANRNQQEIQGKYNKMFFDIIELAPQWLIMMAILTIHLTITFLLPVPGCPTGYLGAGGKQDDWANKNCIGGAFKHIDLAVLGDNHIYQNPTAKTVYQSGSFDPEGVFGCLMSIVHVFFGLQAGNTMLHHKDWKQLIPRWLTWAVIFGLLGGILCGFSKEDGAIPLNKNLWSLSFVLVTSCFALVVLSICYMLIDVAHWWDGSPFIQPGMNPIIMYFGHSICWAMFPFHWAVDGMRTHFIFLVESVWGTCLWILVAVVLARNKFFFAI